VAAVILSQFKKFQAEARIIGRLLAGYGELEYEFGLCIGEAIGDENSAVRALYSIRGEMPRLNLGNVFVQGSFKKQSLDQFYFRTVFPGLNWCREIRNQYAHAHWKEDPAASCLCFADPEKAIRQVGKFNPTYHPIKLDTLKEQEKFFVFVQRGLQHLRHENQKLAGKISTHSHPRPPTRPRPPKYS
jgi:hypothetical protein